MAVMAMSEPPLCGPVRGGSTVSSSASLGSFPVAHLLAEWFVSQSINFLIYSMGRSVLQIVEKSMR